MPTLRLKSGTEIFVNEVHDSPEQLKKMGVTVIEDLIANAQSKPKRKRKTAAHNAHYISYAQPKPAPAAPTPVPEPEAKPMPHFFEQRTPRLPEQTGIVNYDDVPMSSYSTNEPSDKLTLAERQRAKKLQISTARYLKEKATAGKYQLDREGLVKYVDQRNSMREDLSSSVPVGEVDCSR